MSDEVKKGLMGIVVDETTISQVMPEINSLTYRGYKVQDLCEKCIFEEVAYLVLNGELPRSKELKKDIEDDSKELTRKTKKEVSSHIEFLSNTVKKFYTNTKGSLKTLKEKSKEKSKQMFSKLYENIFGEPKAK